MEENKAKIRAICKYKNIRVDIAEVPIRLPKIENMKSNEKFTTLLMKIKSLNKNINKDKYANKIMITPAKIFESEPDIMSKNFNDWKGLAEDHLEYQQMYKTVEMQNIRIKRLKIKH